MLRSGVVAIADCPAYAQFSGSSSLRPAALERICLFQESLHSGQHHRAAADRLAGASAKGLKPVALSNSRRRKRSGTVEGITDWLFSIGRDLASM